MRRFWQKLKNVKDDVYILYLAFKHPATPAPVKIIAGLIVAYILSPVDLIPEFIPVLGYIDELILVPLCLSLAFRLVPPHILETCRKQARQNPLHKKMRLWTGAFLVLALWLVLTLYTVRRYCQNQP